MSLRPSGRRRNSAALAEGSATPSVMRAKAASAAPEESSAHPTHNARAREAMGWGSERLGDADADLPRRGGDAVIPEGRRDGGRVVGNVGEADIDGEGLLVQQVGAEGG